MDERTSPLPRHDTASVPPAAGGVPGFTYEPMTSPAAPQTPARRRGAGLRRVGELSAVAVLAAALASGGTYAATTALDRPSATTSAESSGLGSDSSVVPVTDAQKTSPDWEAVSSAVSPSVVAIAVKGAEGQGQGSGVVIDDQGHVLTNNHVVSGAGSDAQLQVTLADGNTYTATVAGTDPSTDLAVITITDPPKDLKPVSIGSSEDLTVGDPVMAIGNPLGLAGTVTTGIVSALDRPVATEGESQDEDPFAPGQGSTSSATVVTNAIQTSAPINPGNSGGALVDASGRLIGINSSIATTSATSGSIGIGFAIPVQQATMIAEQLIENGSAEHAFLGVSTRDGSATVGSATRAGAEVGEVTPGSPADDAGLRSGDLVIAVGGAPVTSSTSLVGHVRERAVGSSTELTVIRSGKEHQVEVTLSRRDSAN